ncbi:hypothetical protein AGMMS50230_04540 [Spirochaetia bacterium]|nr:hypothetical protein AGMMS50230_04540 [Spirochaetia bacterium]
MSQAEKNRSIGAYLGAVNGAVIISVFAVIAVVAALLFNGTTRGMSTQYAAFYSLGTVEKFDLYMDKELELVRKIAGSRELINWFADNDNQEKKAEAYNRVMGYADVMLGNEFYFGIENSRDEYAVTQDTKMETFVPFPNPLNPELPADDWYFNCLKEKNDYTLNVDIDKDLRKKRLWINYKVKNGDVILGVICSGLYFNEVEETLFGTYDHENARSLVINREGIVQMDSAIIRREGESFDPLIFEEEIEETIYAVVPGLSPALDSYLQTIRYQDYFERRIDPAVSMIKAESYRYMAVVPILNTDWSVVTLFTSSPLVNVRRFLPLLLAFLLFFVVYLVVNHIIVHRLVLLPLRHLTGSLRGETIAGLNRKDEFGTLAKTIHDSMIRIRNEEERGKIMMETTPVACTFWDQKGGFIDCNEETLKLFGVSSKEEYHDHFMDLSPEYQPNGLLSKDEVSKQFEDVMREGKIRFEWMHQKLDGTPLPAEIVLARVKYGDSYFVAGYNWDLRESRRMLGEIEYQSRLLRTMNDVAAILFCSELNKFAVDLWKCMGMIAESVQIDRLRIWKNHVKDGELYCTEVDEWYRKDMSQFGKDLTMDVSYRTLPAWEETLSKGDCIQGLVSTMPQATRNQLDPQGILSILVIPVFLQDQFWGFVGFDDCHREREFTGAEESILRSGGLLITNAIMRNEMTQRIIEAQETAFAASRAKSDFLSNMSHEIRTPLNAIIGMTAIGKGAANTERKDYAFGKIEDAGTHLLGVINDILDMSKIEAEKFELSPAEFNFEKMLQKTVGVINFRVEEKNQVFIVKIDQKIPRFLVGDSQRLAQVIANLLSNAVKFTPEMGTVRLNAQLSSDEGDECVIRIDVVDNGIGISKEQQGRLFNSFVQAENSTSRKYGGTGLGLVISKRIVEMMNGKIWIESEEGKGAAFAFTIRLKKGAPEKTNTFFAPPGKIRMLVIDDDKDIREFFREITGRYEITCDTAETGEAALALIGKNEFYDLCFVDWKLPGMDGMELSRRIFALAGGDSGLPGQAAGKKPAVVLISAADWGGIEEEARKAGITSFLPKPLFPSAVIDCINSCLGLDNRGPRLSSKEESWFPLKLETLSFMGRHILVVDDVEINREILQSLLEPAKVTISCAGNGIEAVQMYTENPGAYDLIFMDIQMPEMDGYEATRQIRAFEKDSALLLQHHVEFSKETALQRKPRLGVPIVAMTANVFREDIERCLAAGMDDHVGKPVDPEELFAMLRKYVTAAGFGMDAAES